MRYNQRAEGRKCKGKSLAVAILLSFTFFFSTVAAQESINAAGGNNSGSEGSVSYSIGQIAYQTHTGANGSVAKGIQQPYEILIVTGIDEAKEIKLSVSAYPNPATDYLELRVEGEKLTDLSYQLYNINGKLLRKEKITGDNTSIVMSHLVPSAYFVKVTQENKELKLFKIIKN